MRALQAPVGAVHGVCLYCLVDPVLIVIDISVCHLMCLVQCNGRLAALVGAAAQHRCYIPMLNNLPNLLRNGKIGSMVFTCVNIIQGSCNCLKSST